MSSDSDDLPENGAVAERFKRWEQELDEFDAALGRVDEQIRKAREKSKDVFREVRPVIPDT